MAKNPFIGKAIKLGHIDFWVREKIKEESESKDPREVTSAIVILLGRNVENPENGHFPVGFRTFTNLDPDKVRMKEIYYALMAEAHRLMTWIQRPRPPKKK